MEFRFEKLEAWIKSRNLVKNIYQCLDKFPKHENYALCDQIRRSAVSVPSNVAEGNGRLSMKERAHFVEIVYGSLMEVHCQLLIAWDLGYITNEKIAEIRSQIEEVAKLLSGYHNWLLQPRPNSSNLNA